MLERIQKIISAAGVTSRRAAEQLILEGRVRVNGQVVTELGSKADAAKDHIKVDGKLINPRQPLTYVMLNKPAGYVTTMADPEGRPTVLSLLKGLKTRVYPVGRLDFNTEGLLLLTNDGEFAHLITHPKHELPKTYRAKVKGVVEDRQMAELENGIYLDDGKTAPAKLKKVSKEEANSWLEITIYEGRKRQVRRMFDRIGHSVIRLKRIKTGSLTLGDLPEGSFRYLTPAEVNALKECAVKEQMREPERQRISDGARKPIEEYGDRLSRKAEVIPRSGKRRSRTAERSITGTRQRAEINDGRRAGGLRVPGQGASGRGPRRSAAYEGREHAQRQTGGRNADREAAVAVRKGATGTGAPAQARTRQRTFDTGRTGRPHDRRGSSSPNSGSKSRWMKKT